jgi:hypothetical protein
MNFYSKFSKNKKIKEKSEFKKGDVKYNRVSYNEYKYFIKPLDLVMFKGGDFLSDFIRFLEKSRNKNISKKEYDLECDAFSHVGIVVNDEILNDPRLKPGKLYIWESTMSGKLSDGVYNIDGKSYLGVQLRDLDKVVKAYDLDQDTDIAFCSVKDSVLSQYKNEYEALLKQRFTTLFIKYNGVRYDANLYSLSSSIFPCLRKTRDEIEDICNSEEWLFCSELVAIVYKELYLIPKNVDPKNVVPMDFVGYDVDSMENGGLPIVVKKPIYITL